MRAVPFCSVLVWTCLAGALGACAKPGPPTHHLAVATDRDAAALVDRFLKAYEEGHVDTAASFLCEQDAESQARARAMISKSQQEGSPFRITKHELRSVEAKWQGTVPYFHVEVAYPRTSSEGVIVHGYEVRAATGCIEGLYGRAAPPVSADPPPSDPKVVPPVGTEAPPATVDAGVDSIEL